ncbi:uncharacterized protein K452DRAFT_320585 [Aplosporella prunicola CBS 121167]|uniref:Deacetylase sirtuin-type domain-containing protein n=1 Tax=Aplosporella prunicola CBS 121167 TaxID=1176127 RepID=A0A6A6B5L5_9PEZI|nr:uncharacterized protein K452DRAFT_320585 [Aplosporella prunicola CBS 121167]KAF2138918.1 hypothetical protein K452DRAFT_320585 [Aplosporella prunicola CBS 121167]
MSTLAAAPSTTPSRPQLPATFAEELRAKCVQEQRKIEQARPAPEPAGEISQADIASFSEHLRSSKRILALCGAGMSAASGIPTFRGSGRFWREYGGEISSMKLFSQNPSLVWQNFNYRRHRALKAEPNAAHFALAELASKKADFFTIMQNIDGLSERANHPATNLQHFHGSLFDVKCTNAACDYTETGNMTDPIVPALAQPEEGDLADPKTPMREVAPEDLPHCPECSSLLRPGVVMFGEFIPQSSFERVDEWATNGQIDLMLVIGTSSTVWPAAGYIQTARTLGARIAVFNIERPNEDVPNQRLREQDWFFQGDAAETVPKVMKEAISGL